MLRQHLLLIPVFAISIFLISCEDDEANDLFAAQECLNNATIATASACEALVAGLNSTQSWIIRCSARTLAAGIDETAIVTAWDTAEAAATDDFEATLITSLGNSVEAAGKDGDDTADAFDACQASEVDGLIYLSGVINIGTQIAEAIGTGLDADAWIDNCEASPASCDAEEIGEVVTAVSDAYCQGGNADSEICTAIESAIAAGGGTNAGIGAALFDLIDPNPGT